MAGNTRLRQERCRETLAVLEAEALLVSNIHNVSYLSGFTGSSGYLLITASGAYFITDFRYKSQAAEEVKGCETVIQKGRWTEDAAGVVKDLGVGSVAFESGSLTCAVHAALAGSLEGISLLPSRDVVESLRRVKDEDETDCIEEAVRRAERGFVENASRVAPGMTESDTALGLEFNIRSGGSLKVPFDIIVASGQRAALPHGIASGREMKQGDTVIIDFGGEAYGYQSDITRSGVLGEADRKQAEIYDIVLEAQQRAIASVRPGVPLRDVDAAARDFIGSRGYGEYFGHGLGHGVGLEVHEAPGVSPMSEDVAEVGMVFTIEPGIYVPGWGGFRIEDMVQVTADGCRLLTSLPRDIGFFSG